MRFSSVKREASDLDARKKLEKQGTEASTASDCYARGTPFSPFPLTAWETDSLFHQGRQISHEQTLRNLLETILG
jgi:hypothetical protein